MSSANLEGKASKDLPVFKDLAKELITLAEKSYGLVFHAREITHEDHLALFLVLHYKKQLEHMKSILKLVPSRDVALIARSMLEGASQLYYVSRSGDTPKIQEAALRFRMFGFIHDWRLLQSGKHCDPEMKRQIEEMVKKYGYFYEKKKSKSKNHKDPYHRDWHRQNPTELIRAFGMDAPKAAVYGEFYKEFSEYHHWNTSGLAVSISWNEEKNLLNIASNSNRESVISIITAMVCLLFTLDAVLLHFDDNSKAKPAVEEFRSSMQATVQALGQRFES